MPNVQHAKKIVYWVHGLTKKIRQGLPEQFPAPKGWEKIVCNNAMQAEFWSNQIRKQEKIEQEVHWQERAMIETPVETNIRTHMMSLMANAKNNVTKEFLRRSLTRYDKRPKPWEWKKESYLHVEAYSENHKD